jgi:transcriptional regulator with XRE-family HTH domain
MTLTAEPESEFRDELRRRLWALNMTRQELAAEVGVSERAVYGWLNGEYSPGPRMRRRLERLFADLERQR